MVTFDSVALSNIFLACITIFNIVILVLLYEHFYRKK